MITIDCHSDSHRLSYICLFPRYQQPPGLNKEPSTDTTEIKPLTNPRGS